MIVESGSRAASLAAATTLTTSFLPKCTHFLQINVALSPLPPTKTSFHGVLASTKQKKKNQKSSSPAREWAYEHFMVLWDEVFEHCCIDPVKATQIRNLSCKGLSKHGRGCVLVFQEVQTLPRGPGTGFTSKPPKTSRRVPDFVTTDYYAVYLPKEFLLDPRKAPLEKDLSGSDDKEQLLDKADNVVVERQGDDIKETINVIEGEHGDLMMGTCKGGDKVIDIDEIVRDVQDVYTFYSDDEDELDDTTHAEVDDIKETINVTEGEHGDLMMGTCEGGNKVIDIDEIVRDVQDVYTFYSDDEDELDDTTYAEVDELGSVGTAASTVELLDKSPEADTSESSGSMENEKGSQYEFNDQGEDEEVPLVTQQMLYACMRGMDRTRLMSLTANFDFEADRFRFARKMAVIDLKTSDAGGEEPYNPMEEELVLLLYLSVDGKPAYGADVVVAYRDECETVGVEKDSWKLRGKYKDIFA